MTAQDVTVMAREPEVFAPVGEHFEALPAQGHDEILLRLRMRAGREESWHVALLHAIGQWSHPNEHVHGRYWHYVIDGEALDWLTLAQRLCLEIPDAMPDRELEALLFHGQLPERVGPERFRRMVGPYRYTALLNFHYGVTVEEALQLLTEDAIRKNRLACCYQDSDDLVEEAHRHLYGDTRAALALQFLDETGGSWGKDLESFSLASWHEFTYWLFKRRIRKWHPARIASDTRRGLECLGALQSGATACPAYLAAPDGDILEEVRYRPYTRR
ncbi:MAG: hypothetical protein F4W95_09970 [Chloroflexi bacterium]|nr:hypothetical protein [Chloroflexota bacterium]MYD48797.1 hypothetical protein [Chloroflexota bacterium]